MPRDRRAHIGTGIWSETSMRRLTRRQRDAYMLVYTQPDLTRCGVLSYRLRYLGALAVDSTEDELMEDFRDLHSSRHLVVDERDEQLLMRTYVKHDGLLSQPLVVASMIRDYHRITSPTIRVGFLAEIRRLWEDPEVEPNEHRGLELVIGANPADVGIKNADKVASAIGNGLLAPLMDVIGDGQVEPFPARGLPKGLTEGQRQGLTEGLPKGPPEGPGGGYPNPRYNARASAPASVPATAPAPATASRTTRTRTPVPADTTEPTEPTDDPTSALLIEHTNGYTEPVPLDALHRTRTAIAKLIAQGITPDRIAAGLTRMRDRSLGPHLLAELVTEATPTRNGRTSTTDQRVQGAYDLAAELRAEGM